MRGDQNAVCKGPTERRVKEKGGAKTVIYKEQNAIMFFLI